jgi:alpha-L-rhamnosidase
VSSQDQKVRAGRARGPRLSVRRAVVSAGLAAALIGPVAAVVPVNAYVPGGLAATAVSSKVSLPESGLRVDGRTGALYAFGDTTPSFSWEIDGAQQQSAYQVRVASTLAKLVTTPDLWSTGKVTSSESSQVTYQGLALASRAQVFWQVRVWDQDGTASEWSAPQFFEMGLLSNSDWGTAQWIENPVRAESGPLPIFAKQVTVDPTKTLTKARLYLSGLGVQVSSVNGKSVTDEVLAPGGTNEQVSAAYRGYAITDLLESGSNTIGVELGNGEAYEARAYNPDTGRTDPYSKILGVGVTPTALTNPVVAGATSVVLDSVTGFLVGQTVNIDTADSGVRLEQRRVTAIDTTTRTITLESGLSTAHAAGVKVTRSGDRDSPNTRVTPRLIARVELTYSDGTTSNVVSDRTWRTATGATTTDNWWGGSDYDARREQVGWSKQNSDLTTAAKRRNGSAMDWTDAGVVGTPNLDTKLVSRTAEPVKIVDTFDAKKVWEVAGHPGTWIFDMGQAFSGFAQVTTPGSFPAGTNVRMQYGESFETTGANAGLINVLDMVEGSTGTTGTQTFDSYTTYGNSAGETWHPQFNYDGFQYIQMTGLPAGFTPTTSMVKGLQTAASAPSAGSIETDNARINRIHKMAHYSIMSNMQAYFTDCPNREKGGWLADMIQSMPAIDKHFDMRAYLQTMMQAMEDAQTKVGVNAGFVPSTTPNDQVRLSGSGLGNDLNWGGAIVLTPFWLFKNYGDIDTAREHWDSMVLYMNYIRTMRTAGTTGVDQYFVNNGLGDWASAVTSDTNKAMTATGAYYKMANEMSDMAKALGKPQASADYAALAGNIKNAYNEKFWNPSLRRYTITPTSSTGGQTAQGLALDYGIVPDEYRQDVLDSLVEMIYAYHPNGGGPHLNSGMIGLGPVTRSLMDNGREDVLWDLLQEDTQPSYGYFLQDTAKHPGGLTTIPEYWDLRQSQNHMILLQADEWFTAGLAGIKQADDSVGYRNLVIRPQLVGDLGHVKGEYVTPYGTVVSDWTRQEGAAATLEVTVPSNSTAEVWAPTGGVRAVVTGGDAQFVRIDGDYAVYKVGPGELTFAPPAAELPSSTVAAPAVNGVYGEAATLTATVGGVANATGTVTLLDGSTTVAQGAVSNGEATLTIPAKALSVGEHQLRLVYSGDENVAGSESTVSVTVAKATGAAVTAPATTGVYGTATRITAVLTGADAATGTITLKDGAKTLATGTVASGKAVLTVPATALSAGVHQLRLAYSGDGSLAGAESTVRVSITKARSALAASVTSKRITTKTKVAISLRVTAAGTTPTGQVRITIGKKVVRTAQLQGGRVTIRLPKQKAGKKRLTITYLGSTNVSGATTSVTVTVKKKR